MFRALALRQSNSRGADEGLTLETSATLESLTARDYEVRERIPVPYDNYFQSFFSLRHAILGNYNPPLSLKLNDVTLTDQ